MKFRSDDLAQFTHTFLRNIAREAFNKAAARYNADDLYGAKKEEVLGKAREYVNAEVKDIGVVIEQFGYVGAPRPPDNVRQAIDAKIAAIQRSIQVENEVRAAKAEAQKNVAIAQGQAQANQILAQSLSPTLIEWRRLGLTEQAIQKWDGRRPTVEGSGSGLLLNVTPPR